MILTKTLAFNHHNTCFLSRPLEVTSKFCWAFQKMQLHQGTALRFPYYGNPRTLHKRQLLEFLHTMQSKELTVFCKGLHFSGKALRSFHRLASLSGTPYRAPNLFKSDQAPSSKRAFSAQPDVECPLGAQTITLTTEAQSIGSLDLNHKILLNKEDDELLRKAITYEAERGFPNCMGRKTRFGEFLSTKLFALSCKHTLQGDNSLIILSESAKNYERMNTCDRVALCDKVCTLLGFRCAQELLDQNMALAEASRDLQTDSSDTKCLSSSTSCDKANLDHSNLKIRNGQCTLMLQNASYPSIVFGSSERIELYNPTEEGKGMLRFSVTQSLDTCSDRSEGVYGLDTSTTKSPYEAAPNFELHANVDLGKLKSETSVQKLKQERDRNSQAKKQRRASKKVGMSDTYESWLLNKPISLEKSLSHHMSSRLDEHGFHTLRKLLQHYPRSYLNFQQAGKTVEDGQYLMFFGKIVSCRTYATSSLGIVEVLIASTTNHESETIEQMPVDSTGDAGREKQRIVLHVKRFFRGVRFANNWFLNKIAASYPRGAHAAVSGKVKVMEEENHFEVKEFNLELRNPDDETASEATSEKPYPVYAMKGGLDAKTIEFCIQRVLPDLPLDIDPLPEKTRVDHELMELREAYLGIHYPLNMEVAEKARQRLVFDEFFYLQLGLLLQKQQLADSYLEAAGMGNSGGQAEAGTLDMEKWAPLTLKLLDCLSYKLTNSQVKAASEIMWDLQRPLPMNRLLQGDVGCGKTIVAFLALLEVIDAGFQGVIMGPTEFLARQHYEHFVSFLEHLDEKDRPQIALLTSSVPASKARAIRRGLESGEIQLAVGTHSLIADSVKFAALGLAIIDEQHRFGVAQRIRLHNKGSTNYRELVSGLGNDGKATKMPNLKAPHILAMSATPIPRTLAFAIHGDMALGQITELPPGRIPVKTYAIRGNEDGLKTAFKMVRDELKKGGRAFIVYPIIDESQDLPNLKAATVEFENIVKEFDGYTCGLVHGKLKANEKQEAMNSFKSGQTQVLVSTTVIEVGIDIPEASIMVVMNAERYGVAQLHQLRGRVGRGQRESTCVLLASSLNSLERLKILEESQDGFYLAEIDLRLRGPGDLLGKQQSGHLPEFSLARLDDDGELMIRARTAAEEILSQYRGLEALPRLKQELSFRRAPNSLGL